MERLSAGNGNKKHSFTQQCQRKRERGAGNRWRGKGRERIGGRPEAEKMAEDSGQSDGGEKRGR